MLRLYILLFIIGTVSAVGYGGYKYITDMQNKMNVLVENNAQLETAVQANEETISSLQNDYAAIQAENERINTEYAAIRRQNNLLANKLADIDLGLIASTKPDSIERAINRGTTNAARCFEILSGSPLNEEEKNAPDANTFNKECPWLWPGINTVGVSGR